MAELLQSEACQLALPGTQETEMLGDADYRPRVDGKQENENPADGQEA